MFFRDHPTVPGDPANPLQEFPPASSTDAALLLPSRHRAFTGCSRCGHDSGSQVDHLLEVHEEDLRDAMNRFHALRPNAYNDERLFAVSVYNEGIALAIRRGAPLASYSIDRRCLKSYMTSLTHSDTNALV